MRRFLRRKRNANPPTAGRIHITLSHVVGSKSQSCRYVLPHGVLLMRLLCGVPGCPFRCTWTPVSQVVNLPAAIGDGGHAWKLQCAQAHKLDSITHV
jgi:hypothetical protein